MRKIIFIIALLFAFNLIANDNYNIAKEDYIKLKTDSLATAFGEMYGYGVANEWHSNSSSYNKEMFLKGLHFMMYFVTETDSTYIQGLQIGMQIKNMINQIKDRENVHINPKVWYPAFKKAFLSDTLKDPTEFQTIVMNLMIELTTISD